jgi:hypothetical protein
MSHYRPKLLEDSRCYITFPFATTTYVVHLQHSSKKIHAFLDYLHGLSFGEIMSSVNSLDAFRLRTSVHSMAREYAHQDYYARNDRMFDYRLWISGGVSPLHVFGAVCRTTNIDVFLVKEVMLRFADHEAQCRALGKTRDWVEWFCKELSLDKLEAEGYTTKIHNRNAKAFDTALDCISEYLYTSQQKGVLHVYGTVQNNNTRRDAALLLLTDAFCRKLNLMGFDIGSVERAKAVLRKQSWQT